MSHATHLASCPCAVRPSRRAPYRRANAPRPQTERPRAMTMIETLLVIALLALATALGAVRLSNSSARARIDHALAVLESADLAARTLAHSHGPITLSVGRSPHRVRVSTPAGQVLWERTLPDGIGVNITLYAPGPTSLAGSDLIHFDPIGRSADYYRTVLVSDGLSHATRVNVSGHTGWSHTVREAAP